jgi:hypothetical protein
VTSRTPIRTAKWLFFAYAAGLAAFLIVSVPHEAELIFIGPFIWAWQVGPVAFAAMLVKASSRLEGAWVFVGVEAAVIGSTIWFFVDSLLLDSEGWSALGASLTIAFSGPFFQYVAVLTAVVLAWVFGWRARESWLKA